MALSVVPTKPKKVISKRPPPKRKGVVVDDTALFRSRSKPRRGSPQEVFNPFTTPQHPPGVITEDVKEAALAFDVNFQDLFAWAATNLGSAFNEGVIFMGYAALSVMAQRPEYRVISECLAYEMTREWIEIKSKGDEDKSEKIAKIQEREDQLSLQEAFRCMALQDGFFGRSHLYIDTGDTDDRDELKTSLGDGKGLISQAKFLGPKIDPDEEKNKEGEAEDKAYDADLPKPKQLKAFKPVEAVWVYPTRYDSTDPLKPNWYKPETWFVQGKEVHTTRLLTFIGREVPDLLKPAYSFGGLSMTQMAKPYVDNWLRTRQSVADIISAFSVFVLGTNLAASLEIGGDQVFKRAEFFNNIRDNRGLLMIDKDSETFANVSASLGTLDALQAQTQEHMAAVARVPIVKLLGIQPAGLNASSEGEIRSYYDWVHAFQEFLFRPHLTTCLNFIQLEQFGEVDPDIIFEFKDLWQLDEAGKAGIQQTKAAIRETDIASGIISPEEGRKSAANDPDSPYQGLDLDKTPPPQPQGMEGEEDQDPNAPEGWASSLEDLEDPEEKSDNDNEEGKPKLQAHPQGGLGRSVTNRAAKFGGINSGGFAANDEAEKYTKAGVEYEDPAKGNDHCMLCQHFQRRGSCELVEGKIAAEAWCDEFELPDGAQDKAFEEAKHPRVSSGEHGGEFTSWSGGSAAASSKVTAKTQHLVAAPLDRAQWPAHIKKLKIPPAWTDVRISPDPKTPLQVIGKDAKGRRQPIYLEKYRKSQSAAKFARVKRLSNKFGQVQSQNDRVMRGKDNLGKEHATVTSLIMDMGLRPGSEKETGAAEKAFGATTLRAEHVVIDGENTYLRFTGKKGVKLNLPVTNLALAAELRERADRGGQLFPDVTDNSLRRYVGKLGGGGFLTKDLRTAKATHLANDLVSKLPVPANEKEYKKAVNAIGDHVSKVLGNTRIMALQAYIAPQVFAPWKLNAA